MLDSAEDTSQADGEGPDGSDKPPHSKAHQSIASTTIHANSTTPTPPAPNGRTVSTVSASSRRSSHGEHNLNGVPLPPPESMAHIKEPGFTLQTLGELIRHNHNVPAPGIVATAPSNQSRASSVGPLSSDSDSSSPSAPSTRPPSRAPSIHQDAQPPANDRRSSPVKAAAAAAHALKNGTDPVAAAKQAHKPIEQQKDRGASASAKNTPASSRRPSVSGSEHNGGQKFNLKDLLASGPKLARRSSARSTASSKKSDSDGQPKSTAGDSTVSLLKKYGVCDRVAIGKGATSVVRIAHKWDRSEEKLYAVKEFRKRRKNETEKEYVKKLTAEFCISSTLHHPNIVETVDLVQDEAQHWCEVMEFCPGGDLYAAIKKGGMAPSEVECCFKQILNGVAYLHSQGVAHRDIKPENLFFDLRGQLKIGDYGASTVYRLPWETTVHMSTGLCGSEPYIAPEQFTGKPYDARLVDIWACGIVYYCLHFQELPWRIAQPSDSLYASYVTACHSSSPQQAACPPTINNLSPRSCRPLLRKMLEPDPKSRWLIEEITQHAWVKGIEVCIDMDKPTHMHQHAKTTVHSMTQAT